MYKLAPLIAAIALMGCTHNITFYEMEPARVRLREDQNKILFISRYDSTKIDFNQKKKVAVYREGYKKLVTGIIDGFDSTMTVTWRDSVNTPLQPDRFIPANAIRSICEEYQSPLLLVLESFQMDRDQEMEVTEKEDGSKDRTAHYSVQVMIPMSLYDSDGNLIDSAPIEGERPLSSRSVLSGLLSVGPSMGNQGDIIYPFLTELGLHYADNFQPHLVPVNSFLYTNKKFGPMKGFIKTQNWTQARAFLMQLYNNATEPDDKAHAAHNLYIVNMLLKDWDEAAKWSSSFVRMPGYNDD